MNAVILAGGSGTRFWPLSRLERPKQFLALEGERSLLRATADRLLRWLPPQRLWVCTTERLRQGVIDQLPEVPVDQILAEPYHFLLSSLIMDLYNFLVDLSTTYEIPK